MSWKTFLSAFLSDNFDVTHKNGKLIISTTDSASIQRIKTTLESIVNSSENLRQRLPYTIQTKTHTATSPATNTNTIAILPIEEDSAKEGLKIFKRIFAKETLQSISNIKNAFKSKEASSKHYILWSRPFRGGKLIEAYQTTLDVLVGQFLDIALTEMQHAFNGTQPLPYREHISNRDRDSIKGFIQQCFGISYSKKSEAEHEARLFFDYGRLYRCLSTAMFTQPQQTSTNHFEIEIDAQLFADRILLTSENGLLLRAFQSDDGSHKAQLTFIRPKSSVPAKYTHVFMLDCSGSMTGNIETLKQQVIEYIDRLRETDPDASIQIIPFSTKVHKIGNFAITNDAEIKRFIKNLIANGQTRLLQTLLEQISNCRNITDETIIYVCTDGYNSVYTNEQYLSQNPTPEELTECSAFNEQTLGIIVKLLEELSRENKLPKIVTTAFGNYDANLLSQLAKITATESSDLGSFDQFQKTLERMKTNITKTRTMEEVTVDIDANLQKFTVPSYHDSEPHNMMLIPFEGPVSVTWLEKQSTINPTADQIPKSTNNDRLNEIMEMARNCLHLDPDKAFTIVGEQLNKLGHLQNLSANDENLRKEYKTELEEYLQTLRGDDKKRAHIQTQAAYRAGFFKQTPASNPQSSSLPSTTPQEPGLMAKLLKMPAAML